MASANGECLAWAARDPSGTLSPYKFSRRYKCLMKIAFFHHILGVILQIVNYSWMQLFFCRSVGADDVYITIMYCGVCYADVHWTRNVTGHSNYPLVPGYGILEVI